MDLVEEAMDHDNNNNHNHSNSSNNTNSNDQFAPSAAVKGKRTKRQRPESAAAAAPASSISSAELSCSTTEEEEDMANCLILLAQGHRSDAGAATAATKKLASRRSAEKARLDVYQCKTCNKCFPSFQALGGHRTSHRKPKIAVVPLDEEKKPEADEACLQITTTCSISKPVLTSNNDNTGVSKGSNKPKAHECSICGLEFSSGQALGGHMRRHRPVAVAEPPEIKKEKNVLSLDLNLPAPPDDDCEELPKSPASAMAFPFENQQPLVFSASALVDCHY